MKKVHLFFFVFLIFLIVSSQSSALKVTARKVIQFEPGLDYKGKMCVTPSKIKEVKLVPTGELAERIELEKKTLDLTEGAKCVTYTVNLPESFEEPGTHKSGIMAKEAPQETGATIQALVGVTHQIWVEVPYPGKYIIANLRAESADAGEPVSFKAKINSKGDEVINSVSGTIDIHDIDGEKIGEVDTNTVTNLESQASSTLTAEWDSGNHTVGDYTANLTVTYDGKEAEDTASFKLGSLEVRLAGYTKEVYKKGIVPFNVQAESYWSQPITGVKAHVAILKEEINNTLTLTEFETLTKTLGPWQTANLKGFLDTNELSYDNYTAKITLSFDNKSKIYEKNLEVVKEPQPEEESPGLMTKLSSLNTTAILLLTTIILAMIALALAIKVFSGGDEDEPPQGPRNV